MQRISGFRRMGDPGLEPGTSSLSGKPFVPSSRANSQLIPANRETGECGRRLETTGRYNLVAPSWPHDRSSRAGCRTTRKRTSCRRYGYARTLRRRAATSLHDRVQGGEPRRVELVAHAAVAVHDGVAMTRVRALRQALPCRLNSVACLPTSSSAGLRRNRCRRGRSRGKPAVEGIAGDAGGAADIAGHRELAGPDRAQDRLYIDPGVPRRVRRRHQRNRGQPPLQRADPRLQLAQIRGQRPHWTVQLIAASQDQVRPGRFADIGHHQSRPGGPLPPSLQQAKHRAGRAETPGCFG